VVLPVWVYTLGRVYSNRANLTIPFVGLLMNLLATIVPVLLGMLIAYLAPRVRAFAFKIAKPLTFVVLFSHLIMVFASKFYMVVLVRWINWLSGPLIPMSGYAIGIALALLLRLPWNQCKTVGIETGLQNVGVAFLIIFTNLRSPEADYAALPLITCSLMTNIPLFIVFGCTRLYDKCFKKKQAGGGGGDEDGLGKHEALKDRAVVAELDQLGEEDENEGEEDVKKEKPRAPIYKKPKEQEESESPFIEQE
jgi:predicted Na+-dependent transporter